MIIALISVPVDGVLWSERDEREPRARAERLQACCLQVLTRFPHVTICSLFCALRSFLCSVKNMSQCPVDHSSSGAGSSSSATPSSEKCPVDHQARSTWGGFFSSSKPSPSSSTTDPSTALPTTREVSSIPRLDGEKWVYPSEAQFFQAMARKKHDPQAQDMRVIVPIHNAVNERAWGEVLKWENRRGGDAGGGPRLVSFKGRPKDRTPKAWVRTLLG